MSGSGDEPSAAPGRARPVPAAAGHDLRGRPPRRSAERGDDRPRRRSRRSSSGGSGRPGCRSVEATCFVAPDAGCRSSRTPTSCSGCSARTGRGPQLPGARAQRARARPSPGARASEHIAIFGSATETFAQQEPQPHRRRAVRACSSRSSSGPASAGLWTCAPTSSMCFGDPWEGAGARRPGRRRRHVGSSTSARASSSLGDTIGVGTVGHVHRAARRPSATAGDRPERTRRCTSTTPTARRWPTRSPPCATASPSSTPVAGGLGRLPVRAGRPPATSPPRTSSGCSTGLGVETGVDLDALVETSVWMAEHLGRPSPSRVVKALAGG